MPIKYPPSRGQILICDFSGLMPHEMSKIRPVIVLSPKIAHRSNICTVVALSTTQPKWIESYHYELHLKIPLPAPFDTPTMWVKGDMLYTVNIERLNRPHTKKPGCKREYLVYSVEKDDLNAIELCVLSGLGITLTKPN